MDTNQQHLHIVIRFVTETPLDRENELLQVDSIPDRREEARIERAAHADADQLQ
jgi:hypothetical protein